MTIRRLTSADSALLRTVRLQSLLDAPSAFGSAYEREVAFTDDLWRDRLQPGGHPHFVSEDADGAVTGIAAGVRDDADPTVAHLMAMWVAPAARGTGAADGLIRRVIDWAIDEGLPTLKLHVTEGNVRAERAYERSGFRRTGTTSERARDGLVEVEMQRRLR